MKSRLWNVGLRPTAVRVELRHRARDCIGVLTEILLIDLALVIDDKSHHSRVVVIRRPRDQRETAFEPAANHVVVSAARRVGTLGGENSKTIAVKFLARLLAAEQRTKRTFLLPSLGR